MYVLTTLKKYSSVKTAKTAARVLNTGSKSTEQQFSKAGVIFRTFLIMVFCLSLIFAPQIFRVSFTDSFVSIFNIEAVKSVWFVFVGIVMLQLTKEVLRLIEGAYTKRYVAVSVLLNVTLLILTGVWLLNGEIINSEFISYVTAQIDSDVALFKVVLENCNVILLGITAFGLVAETLSSMKYFNKLFLSFIKPLLCQKP